MEKHSYKAEFSQYSTLRHLESSVDEILAQILPLILDNNVQSTEQIPKSRIKLDHFVDPVISFYIPVSGNKEGKIRVTPQDCSLQYLEYSSIS